MQIASCFNPSWIFFPKRALAWVCLLMGLFPLVLLFGCAAGSPSFSAQQGIHLQGSVHGGHQPISGSLIQLYAVGTTGNGSAATPLISKDVRTDSSGNFDITGLYTCPSSDSIVYLVAQGGNPGLAAGTNNSSIALLAALGPCGALASSTSISINEVTTVASLWPLAPYAKTSARIGFASESDYQAVGDYIDSLANISAGTAPGPMLTPPDIAPTTKLYTLAGIFSACVNSSGGDAGDGTPCGRLFSDATIGSNAPPSDTVAAAIAIAQHPSQNVADIYYLLPPSSTFQPTLASSPSDWTLPIISTPAAPLLSPASGSYASGQQANIEESTPGASIYYTTDGSVPTGSSLLYSGPFPLTRSQTVNAVAIIDGLSSAGASNTYTINAQVSVSLMPASVTLAPSQTQMFIASVANSSNTAVTWSLNPAVGSISNRGVYTAPAAIATAQTVTVTATSAADSTKAAIAAIALTPAVSVSLTPTTATLGPSQTEAFLASVANSSNTAVTWSLSPAVGSISGSGVYTAPAAIATAQTVTVKATSVADPTKTAIAAIALTPAVSVSLTPATATLGSSQTEAFLASVANSSNTSVTWSLSPAVGSISGSGVYTAPAAIATAQTVTVTATSAADSTKRASSRVTLASIPAPTFFPAPGAYTSTTSVTLSDGDSSAMIYYTTDGSTPSASSIRYTEAIPLSISATVRAIAINGTLNSAVTSGYYTISAPLAVVVTLTPTNAIIPVGLNQQFAAFVAGTQTTAVTWTVSGTGCSGTACGTISSSGLYTAPAVVPSSSAVTITATNLSNAAQSASATVVIVSAVGKTYYLAPAAQGGRDSNSGLTASLPWLTPNHAGLNCGDVIQAAASTAYVSSNFVVNTAPTCAAANNVVWIKCVTFDACKISITSGSGMMFGASYWGVQGWEVDGTSTSGPCFLIYPFTSTTIHHLLFADNVANGCGGAGFSVNPSTQSSPTNYGTDYISLVGNIIYNSAGTTAYCATGIEVYEPVAYDSLPGTHIYIAGNFSDSNVEPSVCNGGGPTDGEGVELDTFDGSQTGTPIYSQQAVIDNNIFLDNGGPGIETANNSAGTGPFSHMYIRHNTVWGNNSDPNESTYGVLVGEIVIGSSFTTEVFDNIAVTNAIDGAASNPIYSYWVTNGNGTDHVYHEFGYAVGGTVDGISSSLGFSYGPDNLFGTNPSFANPVIPGAPNCSGYSSVPACMATVIADFTPTNAVALGYGYQIPSSTPVYDPLYPQWLCSVTNLPAGLVTPGCATASESGSSTTGTSTR